MRDHTEREREARGMVLARMECDWECDAATFVQGPCNCNRASLVDALIAAVRSAVRDEAVQTAKVECSRLASEKADKECKGREGLWEMIEGEESARLSRIVLALTALEATDGR